MSSTTPVAAAASASSSAAPARMAAAAAAARGGSSGVRRGRGGGGGRRQTNNANNNPNNNNANAVNATDDASGQSSAGRRSQPHRVRSAAWKTFQRRFEPPVDASTIGRTAFTTMTYNLLANSLVDLADPDFAAIPPDVLTWPARSKRLQNQLRLQNPDLACIQELDSDCVDEFLRPFARDFVWRFKSRTGDNRDGCALLWKDSVFELLDYRPIEFKNMPAADGSTPLAFMDRDNVAQVAALRNRATGYVVIVGNCHLIFNQNRGDIKLAQVMGMLRVIAEFKRVFSSDSAPEPAVFIGGDFNSTPKSGVYSLLANGVLDVRNVDMRLVSGQQIHISRFATNKRAPTGLRRAAELRHIADIAAQCFGAAPVLPAPVQTEEPVEKKPRIGAGEDDEDDVNDDKNDDNDDNEDAQARRSREDDNSDDDEVAVAATASEVDSNEPLVLHHTLGLSSAYPRESELSRNSATCMRKRRVDQRWVDHIFTSSQLRVVSVFAVPKNCRDKISPFGLPTRTHPSDHLPLCAIVEFANKK